MPASKTLFKSSAFRLGLAMAALLCVAGVVLGVRYLAQAAPFITTDKDQYFSNEIATISGGGFAHNTLYDIPVIRPDGTIVKGDGSSTSGWDTVQSDASGDFQYSYKLDGISGTYTVRVYPYPWDGNRSQTPVATATFTDDNVKAKSGSSGVTFTLTATKYSTANCSGSGSTSTYTHVDWHGETFGVGNLESVKLQAAATSDQGGAFINWTDGVPPDFTDLGGGAICVPGSSGSGGRDYYANYGGTPTPTATNTPTPADTSTPTPTATHTPTPADTSTPTPTATHTPTPTDTSTPTSTATYTPTATSTFTPTPTRTNTPTPTFTPVSPTPTRTSTPVAPTATFTPVPGTPHPGVGGAVLLPAAAVAAESSGTPGGSGQTVAAWIVLAGVAGALGLGGLYARSRRRSR